MTPADDLEVDMFADEIGVATARLGEAVLRSAFQLLYAVRGDALEPVAAEGFLRPAIEGIPIAPKRFLAECAEEERARAEAMALTLHCRNHGHLDLPGLAHVIAVDSEPAPPTPGDAGLICRVREPHALSAPALDALVGAVRGRGMRLAFSGVGPEQKVLDQVRAHAPDIVAFDGAWFRRVAASEGARLLLAPLVAGLKEQGAMVLVPGIEAQSQLRVAIDAGADLLQGYGLSRPVLAGSVVGPLRIPLARSAPHDGKVIPMFSGLRA